MPHNAAVIFAQNYIKPVGDDILGGPMLFWDKSAQCGRRNASPTIKVDNCYTMPLLPKTPP